MSREVQCAGLGFGITVGEVEGQVCAFVALGEDPDDEDAPVLVARLPLDRLNNIIGTLMSIANELSSLESELAAVPEDKRQAHLMKIASRYSAGMN